MKLCKFSWLLLIITGLIYLHCQPVYAVDPNDGKVDLPLNRMGQSQYQKSANDNVSLFQNAQVGDLGKRERQQEYQRYKHLFVHSSSKITLYNDHNLFIKSDHCGQLNYTHKPTNDIDNHHYYAYLVIIVLLSGSIITWKMVKKNE